MVGMLGFGGNYETKEKTPTIIFAGAKVRVYMIPE
jgi:hypothetical protein